MAKFESGQNDADRNHELLLASIDAELASDQMQSDERSADRKALMSLKEKLATKAMDRAAQQAEIALARDKGSGI